MANIPDNSWYNRQVPSRGQVQNVWAEASKIAFAEVQHWLPKKSPVGALIKKCRARHFHACICEPENPKEEDENFRCLTEMPSFELNEDEDSDELESEEEGGTILIDSPVSLTENSQLSLHMEVRHVYRNMMTAGIMHHRSTVIEIPHGMGMKIVAKISAQQRRQFANILLFQLAEGYANDSLDGEEDGWQDLATVVDLHLDLPNVRELYREIAGL